MLNRNKMKKWLLAVLWIFLLAILGFPVVLHSYGQWKEDHSGIPDAVSSSYDGSRCRLSVVANSDDIGDREAFAREVVEMCRDNAFHSIRLSTDVSGWPNSLDIAVYLHRRDIGNRGAVMRIRYEPADGSREHDIKNDPDQYKLIIES